MRKNFSPSATSYPRPEFDSVDLTGPERFLEPARRPQSIVFSITGLLSPDRLESALNQLREQHPRLLAERASKQPGLATVKSQSAPCSLARFDLRKGAPETRLAEARNIVDAAAAQPFDWHQPMPFQAGLAQIDDNVHWFWIIFQGEVVDRRSLTRFLQVLSALYESLPAGQPRTPNMDPAPAMPEQPDENTSAPSFRQQLAYWQTQLAQAPLALELPTDVSPTATHYSRMGTERRLLDPGLTQSLQALSQQADCTLFVTLLAAWQTWLSRICRQTDVLVGTTISQPASPVSTTLQAPADNILALRADLSHNPTFRHFLTQVQATCAAARMHADVPFETLVAAWNEMDGTATPPRLQAFFECPAPPTPQLRLQNLQVTTIDWDEPPHCDLALHVNMHEPSLALACCYDAGLFEKETIRRMLANFETLLSAIVRHPEQTVADLAIVNPAEWQQMVVDWNTPVCAAATNPRVHELFAQQAHRTPDAIAVVFQDQFLSYRELNARANQLAHLLRARGVVAGSLVGLCVDRSLEMVVGILGILKAGGAYLPLDPQTPADRRAWIIADAQPTLVLSTQSSSHNGPADCTVLQLDSSALRTELAQHPTTDPAYLSEASAPDDPAYVIYTSGSTGQPKGVIVTHNNVSRLFSATNDWFHFGSGDIWTLFHSYAFDFSVWEFWGALIHGGRLVVVPWAISRSPDQFLRLLVEQQVTVLNQTPSAFYALLQADHLQPTISDQLKLRYVIFGGEALDFSRLEAWYQRHADDSPVLINMYGITETTVHVTYKKLNRELARTARGSLIGERIPDLTLYVLDDRQQPVPIGVPGEMYVGGAGVARGYLNRPELTAERFLPNRFSSEPTARLYRTGDLARWTPKGDLEYLGRIDHQVKLRGFRIELGEIEAALQRHPGVRQAVVLLREDQPGDQRLVAYVVPTQTPPAATELREFLETQLPDYMVPATCVALDHIPLTSNGKIDRRALPAPDTARPDLQAAFVAPRTRFEDLLAQIWCEVLGLDRVGVQDNFFQLGGHSLRAMTMVSRLRHELQIEVPISDVFEYPTIAVLAERIERLGNASADEGGVSPPLLQVSRDTPLPLSFAQERLWFIDQFEPGSPLYNIPWLWRLEGDLQIAALEASLRDLVLRHEALRTTFQVHQGQCSQVIGTGADWRLDILDLRDTPRQTRATVAQAAVQAEAQRAFDLSRDLLFRASLVRLADTEFWLLLNVHHIAADGWSMSVLERELGTLYASHVTGQPALLPELTIQYADYALWQRQWLQGTRRERQLEYWKSHLAGVPQVLELPTDYPRPAVLQHQGAVEQLQLDEALLTALRTLGQREGVTLFMTALAAWQVVLARYARVDEILLGAPTAGRNRGELNHLIGFFVNTLALRTDLSGNPTFRELLQRVRAVTLGAYEHQDLPFETLVDELQPQRDLSHLPLIQSMFVLQNAPSHPLQLTGLQVTRQSIHTQTSKFEITLQATETHGRLLLEIEYNTELFSAPTIQRMLRHYQTLLTQAISHPQTPIAELPLLTAPEWQQIVLDWNQTATDFPRDLTIPELVVAHAQATPNAPALVCGNDVLTYHQLCLRANQLAHVLGQFDCAPQSRIAICLERSIDLVVSMLAILKTGCGYVPLDPAHPPERQRFMISDSGATLILTHSALGDRWSGTDVPVFHVDQPEPGLPAEFNHEPDRSSAPDDIANVIYTSGSTGTPKGVLISHQSVVRLVRNTNYLQLDSSQRVLCLSSPAFDASTFEIWGALCNGATCVLYAPQTLDLNELRRELHDSATTCVLLTPSLFNSIVDSQPDMLQHLHHLLLGGEALSVDHVRRFRRLYPEIHVINAYGPTECAVIGTTYDIPADLPEDLTSVPIGRPISNTQAYVCDSRLLPVPIGVPGELLLGGAGLARGYLNRERLTHEKFVANPFSQESGSRLYRTGDLVRWRADGQLEFLGRLDLQVKLRGFRIELEEIETLLAQHPQVAQAVVVLRDEEPSGKYLAAYIVSTTPEILPAPIELRQYLQRRIPEYMIPSAFVTLDALPVNSSGKVDRRALPAPDTLQKRRNNNYVPARTPQEEILTDIWASVLHFDKVGIHDNFFEIGGHSLLATQVVGRMRALFGCELPIRTLFEHPTIAGLAECIATPDRPPVERLPLVLRTASIPAVPSFAQERLWFFQQLEPANPAYNIPFLFRFSGRLDPAAFENSLRQIISRHQVLRTIFRMHEGRPELSLLDTADFRLRQLDLRSHLAELRTAEACRLAGLEARQPFDLAHDFCLRALLVRCDESDWWCVLTFHHIAADGWSQGIFARELSTLYTMQKGESAPELPALPVQYADFAAWQRNWLQGSVLEQQLAYWRQQLAGAPPVLALPTDFSRPDVQRYLGAHIEFTLAAELVARLESLSQAENCSLFMTLLAAWQILLARISGQDDVVVGVPIAGRSQPEVEGLIGFFINTLVLRADLSDNPPFRELLRRVRNTTLDAYAHQDLPFEKLVEALQPERNLSRNPLFQVLFVVQNAPADDLAFPDVTVSPQPLDNGTTKFDLTLTFRKTPAGLSGTLSYNVDLFEPATIHRWISHLQTLLTAISTQPQTAVAQLPVLTPHEREQLLESARACQAELPEQTLLELFEAQVERTPQATAAVAGERALSYRDLNDRANELAHVLIERGIGPEVLVGLCADRSFEMLVGLLGILKAGGAYAPLDPDMPLPRLQFLIEDAELRCIVTSPQQAGLFAAGVCQTLTVDTTQPLTPVPHSNPSPRATLDHPVYLLYTSGSTGQPKGVVVEHRQLLNYAQAVVAEYEFQPGGTFAMVQPLTVDSTQIMVFPPLIHGGTIHLIPRELALNAAALADYCVQHPIDYLKIAPSHLSALLTVDHAQRLLPARGLIMGGEASHWTLVSRLAELRPACRVWNHYGPTETTVGVCTYPIDLDNDQNRRRSATVPIGRPFPNASTYILDRHGEVVPTGVAGELYIGGAFVARGYLKRPNLTAQQFIADPFSDQPGARLYRSGDFVRRLPSGDIEFLGRQDGQLKIRGIRIETGEIEAALHEHPDVRESVVILTTGPTGQPLLIAYVVPRPGTTVSQHSLRDLMTQRLPDAMRPMAYVFLDALPRTPHGKVQRQALPQPTLDLAPAETAYIPPRTPTEELLAAIWASVLNVPRVGALDNFFALGGHSLLAVQLLERMRRAGLHSDVRTFFSKATLADLAAALTHETQQVQVPPNLIPDNCQALTPEMLPLVRLTADDLFRITAAVPAGCANIQDIYPLSPLQEGILFHHLLETERDPYLLCTTLAFDSRARLDHYLQALQAVVDRHDILRTSIVHEGLSEPVQVVWRRATLRVEELTLDDSTMDVARALKQRFSPENCRLEIKIAPIWRLIVAEDRAHSRWLLRKIQHHLTSDHVTSDLVEREIEVILQGHAQNLPAPAPYRNYIAQTRFGVTPAEHQAFFSQMLAGVDSVTAPYGLTAVHGDGTELAEVTTPLEANLSRRIRACARDLRISAASLMHLAWARVLAGLSGQDDVVFGTVLFGRMDAGPDVERVLGLFINTLPVRVDAGQISVTSAVQQTQARLAELLKHEHASLALAQRCSAIAPPQPLFTTFLNYRYSSEAEGENPTGAFLLHDGIHYVEAEARTNYPLTLSVDDFGAGFSLTARAHVSIDPGRVGAYMVTVLTDLITALESAPDTPVCQLHFLPATERSELLAGALVSQAALPDQTLLELFEAQVERTPQATAAVAGGRSLSYRELNDRANQLANVLIERGTGPEVLVGLCADRSLEMLVGLLGILKAGGAYVPLDPDMPLPRLQFIIEDAELRWIVTSPQQAGLFAAGDCQTLTVDTTQPLTPVPLSNPSPRATLDHPVYLLYTSGSTGQPKGVIVEHRQLLNYVQAVVTEYDMQHGGVCAMVQPLTVDSSQTMIFPALVHGGAIHLISRELALDAAALADYCVRHPVDYLKIAPSHLSALLTVDQPQRLLPARGLIVGGEASHWTLVARLAELSPACRVWNHYGPTETTVGVFTYPIDLHDDRNRRRSATVPIGHALTNVTCYVLDRHGDVVPTGVVGELYIGGAAVARGYLKRPDLTQQQFVPDPFSDLPGARLYRSGDFVRRLPSGDIEFLGRQDGQLKIRGIRIETGEIEAALHEHPDVRESVVILTTGPTGQPLLIAYVVPQPGATLSQPSLRELMTQRLPEVMRPMAYVFLDALPRTPHGKVQRQALPQPTLDLVPAETAYIPPRTPTEELLAAIWASVLNVPRVGALDNFFALGGHSLLAIRIVARIHSSLATTISIRTLFENPVLANLATQIDEALSGLSSDPDSQLCPVPRDRPLPLSFAQERLWFLDQLEPQSSVYNIRSGVRLQGPLNRTALEQSLSALLARHEILRTSISTTSGVPEQIISPTAALQLEISDLTGLPESERQIQARLKAEQEWEQPFDLSHGPLLRCRLYQFADEDHWLTLTLHHIVSDGWSSQVFWSELTTLYDAFAAGRPSPLRELPIQYADYAVWQRQWLKGEVVEQQLEYWKRRLAGAPTVLELPCDRPRPAIPSSAGATQKFFLDAELTAALRAISRRENATLFMTLLAAWQVQLFRYSRQDDILIGTPIAGRNRAKLDGLIGFFVNMLVMRADLSNNPPFRELLKQVRETALGAFAHQDLPFEKLVEELHPHRHPSHSPLFQVAFVWQNIQTSNRTLAGVVSTPLAIPAKVAKFDLTLSLDESEDGLYGTLEYRTGLFTSRFIEQFLRHFQVLLAEIAANPDRPIGQLPLLTSVDRHQLLVELNAIPTSNSPNRCVHELFEDRAQQTPDAVAVVFDDRQLTYSELNRRANQLAHGLIARGVQ
ncbi:MAG: amino acid adenylation domain-containing protein, partial [Planctomycetes bacterium]|nr:amino acid adenylation domain-containing protein [Planctomycetota bacterium]